MAAPPVHPPIESSLAAATDPAQAPQPPPTTEMPPDQAVALTDGDESAAHASPRGCYRKLRRRGVRFERVHSKKARGVRQPIKLSGPVGGIEIRGARTGAPTNILDCQLAHALLDWAPTLRQMDIVAIDHYSMYRRGNRVANSKRISGHAHGLAIDAARFQMRNGAVLSIDQDWGSQARGADPCKPRALDDVEARVLRHIVCKAAELKLFQIILTPHYNRAHHNHIHLELKPGASAFVH